LGQRFVLGVDLDGALATSTAALRRLSDEDVHIRIITHRLFQRGCAADSGLARQLRRPVPRPCFTGEKVAVGADMYVEDTPKNVEALRAVAPAIVYTNSTNRDVADPRADDWGQVEQLVLEERERWRERQTPDKDVTGR
jgi:5' nucleotidase, deoxy (Pyrimidine), cytosolic type C protein (NT5C)